MNQENLKIALCNTPETQVKVSAAQHQDIMRAVRLSASTESKATFNWKIPAWSTGLAATAAAVFYFVQPPVLPLPIQDLAQTQNNAAMPSLFSLTDKLALFSEQAPLPEKQLRQELERLKSDLERFDFRS